MDERQALRETRELNLLSEIERNPDATQIGLAAKLGVAVGTVNWHLKRMVAKGYVKVKRAERRKLRYIITPAGLALRARLTVDYIENSMRLYRQLRHAARRELSRAQAKGYRALRLSGEGDVADVCRLTALEMGVRIIEDRSDDHTAVLSVEGNKIHLHEPAEAKDRNRR
ncbi:MAG TPA: winged helix-turn-helix transcriptional regulator [Anaerolineales bacterium]|nr:winged helix-turn-helix transcriptional regulator [Anaerolineales bacterium]